MAWPKGNLALLAPMSPHHPSRRKYVIKSKCCQEWQDGAKNKEEAVESRDTSRREAKGGEE